MKKNVLFVIAAALFIIPEIFFSPILNILTSRSNYIFRESILFNPDIGIGYLNTALVLQSLGAFAAAVLIFSQTKIQSQAAKIFLSIIFALFGVAGLFSLLVANAVANLKFF